MTSEHDSLNQDSRRVRIQELLDDLSENRKNDEPTNYEKMIRALADGEISSEDLSKIFPRSVNPHDMISTVTRELRPRLKAKGLRIRHKSSYVLEDDE